MRITSAGHTTLHKQVQLGRQYLCAMHVLCLCCSCDRDPYSAFKLLCWIKSVTSCHYPLLLTTVKQEVGADGYVCGKYLQL